MKVYARKQPQQKALPKSTRSSAKPLAARSHIVDSIPYLQRTIGNQAIQRLLQTKLTVTPPGDIYEQEADRVSEQVMRMPEPQLQRACACGGECSTCQNEQAGHEHLQTKRVQANDAVEISAPSIVNEVLHSLGQPLDTSTREFMESRFGHDFSHVRVHTDVQAAESARSVKALAFTVGKDVVFRAGQYVPGTVAGRRLLAHELTHVVQQGAANRIERTREKVGETVAEETRVNGRNGVDPVHAGSTQIRHAGHVQQVQRKKAKEAESADPLCKGYEYPKKKFFIGARIYVLKATGDVEKRLDLIRELKWVWRCGTEAQKSEINAKLVNGLGAKEADAIWKEAGTPFGGYRGAYPGYYSGKGMLKGLGVSEVEGYDPFAYDPRKGSKSTRSAVFQSGREATATTEAPIMGATDLLYFYGHQYAQLNHPGVFANFVETQFIDLRALAGKGDFGRVKLIVSTSCATSCKEAAETFSALFPNAVILGFRRSAPKNGGPIRNAFNNGIKELKKPLLLDQPVDVNAIISVWKSVAKSHFPKEDHSQPAYYQSGIVHYLENGIWKSIPATNPANACVVRGTEIEQAH